MRVAPCRTFPVLRTQAVLHAARLLVLAVLAVGCDAWQDTFGDPEDEYPGFPYPRLQVLVSETRVPAGRPVPLTVRIQCADPCPTRTNPPGDAGTGAQRLTHCLSVMADGPVDFLLPFVPGSSPGQPVRVRPPTTSTWVVRGREAGRAAFRVILDEGPCEGEVRATAASAVLVLEFVSVADEGDGGSDAADDDADAGDADSDAEAPTDAAGGEPDEGVDSTPDGADGSDEDVASLTEDSDGSV